MAIPRRTAAALAAAALTLTLAACSAADNPAEGPGSGETSLDRGGAPLESSSAPATTGGQVHTRAAGRIRQADVEVDVHTLERVGEDLVELTLTIHVIGGGLLARDLASPETSEQEVTDMAAFELVDAENGRVHRVATDSEGRCVCSRLEPSLELWPEDSLTLSATFAAPPKDVHEMDVRVPGMPTFTGVPVA
ncbi:hypothetical protein ACOQFV_21900 [Nocardiopsis changdeensis]|uniref:DUF4352 domain-containing protein n=1 Tax=Nocardiopsis changdeensis TaxID=2831969 RepID=A0ABX8BKC4_9ACTN|nr:MULTISPECIES: hypothetical protein [Nocardiopsis]QUX21472.1 hypothetical protein KGD84_24140 [Nocardiopsis changdeensis]QYX37406.1 hypothetical protein K1J57_01510 [Nocardiopsis sp. MT53]